MSTDPSTNNQDLPTNLNSVTEARDSAKTSPQAISDDPSNTNLDQPSGERMEDSLSRVDLSPLNPSETDLEEIFDLSETDQHKLLTSSQIRDNKDSTTQFEDSGSLSRVNLISSSQLQEYLQKMLAYVNKNLKFFSESNTKLDEKMEKIFKENTKLDEKADKIFQENTQLHLDFTNLTEKNKQQSLEIASLTSEITSLNERLAKLEESAKFKFDALIQDALKQDDAVWDEDSEECQKDIARAKLWHSKTEALYTSVLTAISDCGDRIDKCGDLMQEINKENSTLHNSLLDRYKSLELSKRMLERLREPIELLKKSTLPSEQLLRLQPQDLVDLLRSQNDEAEAQKILVKKVKETGDTRYKSIREWRDLAEKSQKQWLNFIEKKLLFALDGINDGKPYAEHLVAELINSYKIPSCQQKLSDWLQTYVDLENILLETLKNLDITQMLVVRGQPIDYDRHEPIGTEPDPNLPHESIKEVTRNGYEYKLPEQEQPSILRSAQVIVVKNK